MDFKLKLIQKLMECFGDNHKDNWDFFRFGKEIQANSSQFIPKISNILNRKGYVHFVQTEQILYNANLMLKDFWKHLEKSYDLLEDELSKKIYVEVIAYKILGYKKVKLSSNNSQRLKYIKKIKNYKKVGNILKSNFNDKVLSLFQFKYNKELISLYTRSPLNPFFLKQYSLDNKIIPESGDVVIDCGACWGDTPLEFASTVGKKGFVYAFEFIPRNLEIVELNLSQNPTLSDRIKVIRNAVWSTSDEDIYYIDNGPSSKISFEKMEGFQGSCKTLSIDDLVKYESLSNVDFIKMDIEGAETNALKGAQNTIKKFKPNLAISIYHSLCDYSKIAIWINSLSVGYKFHVRHYTIHAEETILYASCKK